MSCFDEGKGDWQMVKEEEEEEEEGVVFTCVYIGLQTR